MSNGPYYPPPPGYPPQQPQGQPQGYPPQAQPPAQPPAQPQATPPGQPGQLPAYHMPDESAVQAAYQQARQEAQRFGQNGDGPQFLKFPGPQGQTRWDASVPVGYESVVEVYILPPWAPGKNIFMPTRSHFYKSQASPQGTSIGCPGGDTCLVCQAKDYAMGLPDPRIQEQAKNYGRVRKQFLYNVVVLNNPNGHYDPQTGVMRPFILGAGVLMHNAIGDLIEGRGGAMNIVDPMKGRPIRLKRRKTGPQMMDVEYSALDSDPRPLPPEFYPCLQNLWDLEAMQRTPDYNDMMKAVTEMGLPLPGGPATQPQQGYNPATPAAPYPSPYGQPVQPVGAPQAPTYMPPPADYTQQVSYPPQAAPVAPPPPQVAPPMSPPPVQSQPGQAAGYPPPQPGQVAPPPLPPPPPVTAPQQVQGAPRQPQAAPQGAPPPPPAVTAPPGAQAAPERAPVAPPPPPAAPSPAGGQTESLESLQNKLTGQGGQ